MTGLGLATHSLHGISRHNVQALLVLIRFPAANLD